MSARIRPGGLREIGPAIWVFSRLAGRITGTGPPAVFTTLGRGRGLFWGWLHFAARLMPGGVIPRRETELVILRVAHQRQCDYEFSHHSRLGRRAGLTTVEIERVQQRGLDGWAARDRTLLAAADALVRRRDLDDAEWAAIRALLNEREALELLLLVGHYDMLATTLLALRLEPDSPR